MAVAGYRKKDYRRACDICGGAAWFSEMRYIGQNRWACDVDAPGLTAEQISRHNARVRPLVVKPHKHPKQRAEVPDYLLSEAMLFSLVRDQWAFRNNVSPTGGGTVTTSAQRAGAAGMYFAEIIDENERPADWIAQSRTQLRAIADFIITQQYGSPGGPSPSEATNSVLYGMVQSAGAGTAGDPATQTYCGLTLARAYRILGDTKYLDAANLAATFLRQGLQRRDVAVSSPTTTYIGGFPSSLSAAKAPSDLYITGGAIALWFLSELRTIVGGSRVYGTTTATGDFTGPPSGTLDTMLAEARAFYAGGRKSDWSNAVTQAGTYGPLPPLSSTTPRDFYTASTGVFSLNLFNVPPVPVQNYIQGFSWCVGLRGLFEYEGYSASVAAVYEWLLAFSSNPYSELPAGTSTFVAANQLNGTYDPDLAIASFLTVADAAGSPVAMNFGRESTSTSNSYTLAGTALLAPVRVASGRDCRRAKDATASGRRALASVTDTNQFVAYPGLRGLMGFASQMFALTGSAGAAYASTTSAALVGSLYRYAPKPQG